MKKYIIIVLFICIPLLSFTQDSVKVAKEDLEYVQGTIDTLEKNLDVCKDTFIDCMEALDLAKEEIDTLRNVIIQDSSIIESKDQQLEKRQEQTGILKKELKKKKIEVWAWRGVCLIVIVASLFGGK